MPEKIETGKVVDNYLDELEYGVKRNKTRYEKQREAYEQAEREGTHGERKHTF